MAVTKKSVKKPTVKKTAAKKPSVKKAVVKQETCKCECCKNGNCTCGCANGGKCTCHDCKCEHCDCGCGCKKDSVKYTNMFAAFRAFWCRGYTEWAGTSSRSEYWLSLLANVLVCVLFGLAMVGTIALDNALFTQEAVCTSIMVALGMLYVAASIIPSISMLTRRMHDAGLSAWFWLLYLTGFIPFVGSYIWTATVLVIALLPTRTVDNPYHKYNK